MLPIPGHHTPHSPTDQVKAKAHEVNRGADKPPQGDIATVNHHARAVLTLLVHVGGHLQRHIWITLRAVRIEAKGSFAPELLRQSRNQADVRGEPARSTQSNQCFQIWRKPPDAGSA